MTTDSPFPERLIAKLAEALSAPIPDSTPRQIHGVVALPGKATAVIGMRRAGKTTYLHQLRRERLERGTRRERLVYVNFEEEGIAGMPAELLGGLAEEYYRRYPQLRRQEVVTWCLDEIQTVPGWERFVRRMLDAERVEVFVSGSSAALLSREIATSMRGRAWEVLIHPFSFEEALRHRGMEIPEDVSFLAPEQRSKLERAFLDYLEVGGFPEIQAFDTATRRRVLSDYVDVAMLRDVAERHSISNLTVLRWLVRHLLGNAAGLFSVEKFFKDLKSQGLRVSKDTVHEIVAHLADCFLVRIVWVEASSERQRMVNPRKVYPVDPALIPIFDRTGRANVGHALETAVLIELERRRMEITYVRTSGGHEVDFLARAPEGGLELIQVCADARAPQTLARELRALEEAAVDFPQAGRRLLTLTADSIPPERPAGIVFQPAYEWMLK